MVRFNKEKNANEVQFIEIFRSLNGEGWAAGKPCVFVRLMYCNLRCKYGSILDKNNPKSPLNSYCDTPECFSVKNYKLLYPERKEGPQWLTAKEIFEIVEKMEEGWAHKSICLTGGEPLMECNKNFLIKELFPLFLDGQYDISIETNGSIDYSDYKKLFGRPYVENGEFRKGVTLITDWKMPSSKMTSKMKESNFSIFDDTDIIKCVISDDEEDWKEMYRLLTVPTKATFYLSPMWGKVQMDRIWEYVSFHAEKPFKAPKKSKAAPPVIFVEGFFIFIILNHSGNLGHRINQSLLNSHL